MKKKILLTILLAVIVGLLAFCNYKMTHAYTTETGSEPFHYNGYYGVYSCDVGSGMGNPISWVAGDNPDFPSLDGESHEYFYYRIRIEDSTIKDFITLNFYSRNSLYYMQVITFIDGDIIKHIYNYQVDKDWFINVILVPGGDYYPFIQSYSIIPGVATPGNYQMEFYYYETYSIEDIDSDFLENYDLEFSVSYSDSYHYNYIFSRFALDTTLSPGTLFNLHKNDALPMINQFINRGYNYGYNGASNEIEQETASNYARGYQAGLRASDAYDRGHSAGYQEGLDDAVNNGTAVSPILSLLSSIAEPIGAILSIRLAPNITIGTLILIPLFFAVLGLVLWIWRKN